MSSLQRRVIKTLTAPLLSDIPSQLLRRENAVDALVAYCSEEEPLRSNVLEARRPASLPELENHSSQQALNEIRRSVLVSVTGDQVRCSLGQGHGRFKELCQPFYSAHMLARHFTSMHLDNVADNQRFICPNYKVALIHKNHLRLHAEDIHGIRTDWKRQMRYLGRQ